MISVQAELSEVQKAYQVSERQVEKVTTEKLKIEQQLQEMSQGLQGWFNQGFQRERDLKKKS